MSGDDDACVEEKGKQADGDTDRESRDRRVPMCFPEERDTRKNRKSRRKMCNDVRASPHNRARLVLLHTGHVTM
jgi:hypothetical protein